MKTLIMIFIMLFCTNVVAQECKFLGGMYEIKSQLLAATCPNMPPSMSTSDLKIETGKCGTKFGSVTQASKEGCLVKLEVLTMFEEKQIYGFNIIDMTCPTKEKLNHCYAVYKFILVPKTVVKEEKKDSFKQETDKE